MSKSKLFTGCEFPDCFSTVDGRLAIYACNKCGKHYLLVDGYVNTISYDDYGIYSPGSPNNIKGRYLEQNND